jgi:hypothetical protein
VGEIRQRLDAIDGPLLVGLERREHEPAVVLAHPPRDLAVSAQDHLLVLTTPEQARRMVDRYHTVECAAGPAGNPAPTP